MFREQRDFSVTAMNNSRIMGVDNVIKCFPQKALGRPESVPSNYEEINIYHFYYFSRKRWSFREDLDKVKQKDGTFRYNLYYLYFHRGNISMSLFAAPFLRMLNEVMTYVQKYLTGQSPIYYLCDLEKLNNNILNNIDNNGTIKLIRSDLRVEDDSLVDMVSMSGQDPLHSHIFNLLKGQRFDPRICRIFYDGGIGQRIKMLIDGFGNITFRVNVNAINIQYFAPVLNYLLSTSVLSKTHVNPVTRKLRIEEEGS